MKHKKFNEVFPYTYLLIRISDNVKYHGVRYANVRQGVTPNEDFGINYFTSGTLCEDFKINPSNYKFRLCWTFATNQEALDYEYKINSRIVRKPGWANRAYGKTYIPSPEAMARGQKKTSTKSNRHNQG